MTFERSVSDTASTGRARVLLVEDTESVRQLYQAVLATRFRVDTAANGSEATKHLNGKTRYDVVLADCYLPDRDGITILNDIKERDPATSRILMTAKGDAELAARAVAESRIFRFLVKPCSPKDLIAAVEAGHAESRLARSQATVIEQTLGATVKSLLEIASERAPRMTQTATQTAQLAHAVHSRLKGRERDGHDLLMAVHLMRLGCLRLSDEEITRLDNEMPQIAATGPASSRDRGLNTERLAHAHAAACQIVEGLPKLDRVAGLMRLVSDPDGTALDTMPLSDRPASLLMGSIIRLAARYAVLSHRMNAPAAISHLRHERTASEICAEPLALQGLEAEVLNTEEAALADAVRLVAPSGVMAGCELLEDVYREDGRLLLAREHRLSDGHTEMFHRLAQNRKLMGLLAVRSR